MVHSIELIFDPGTEAAVRRSWKALIDLGISSPALTSRPHVTLAVAQRVAPQVDELLSPVSQLLPLNCLIGAPVLFGRVDMVFARLVVPSSDLLTLHADVHRLCGPHLTPGPMPNTLPGQWTAHVTMARRVNTTQLGSALSIASFQSPIDGRCVGLRRWNGNQRVEYRID